MAQQPLRVKPVFLSASIPDPRRDGKYFRAGNNIAIRNAVIALATVTLARTNLVFAGHPTITPLVKWVADQFGTFDRLRMFQSQFFRSLYLKDIGEFRYQEVAEVSGDREASLLRMRTEMMRSEEFGFAIFIGGMEGVEQEYEMLAKFAPAVPRFPVYTTGAAARLLWRREASLLDPGMPVPPRLNQFRTNSSYAALFTDLIEEGSNG